MLTNVVLKILKNYVSYVIIGWFKKFILVLLVENIHNWHLTG